MARDLSQEVLEFDNNTPEWLSTMAAGAETTVNAAKTSDTNDAFLKRPVKIGTWPWRIGEDFLVTFDPWTLFFENSKVINRVAHFKNLRATLNVKFLLNGNPFYYGRIMAAYDPLPNLDDYIEARPGLDQDRIAASQRPKVFLDPTESQGGDIMCPFIFPTNAVNIPESGWNQLGNITMFQLNGLQHANGLTDPITITAYAYCTDFDLSTPTSQLPATMRPQMAEEYGLVSGPAHTIANWSGKLNNAPVIGKYARATQMVSSAVGGIAQLFGFSRPRNIELQKNLATANVELAVTNIPDQSMSLALDAKKEITVDPTVTGASNIDEMALVPLACKESYVSQFNWNIQQPPDTHLFSIRVGPQQGDINPITPSEIHMTPSAWVSMPFDYWTGSTEFRSSLLLHNIIEEG